MAFLSGNVFVAGPVAIAREIPATTPTDSAVLSGLRITGTEFLLSFALAAVIGVALGAVLGATVKVFQPMRHLLQISFALPQVAIYPIFTLWLGVGFSSKVAFGVTHGLFPVVLGTMAATKLVHRSLIDSARAMGAGRATIIRKVVLPSVLPDVVTSLRLASALCLLGVLLAG